MPEQLLGYVSRAFGGTPQTARAAAPGAADLLPQVLHLLRDRSGHDFTHYKTDTLRRRVERRIAVTRVEGMDSYLTLLKRDSLEAVSYTHLTLPTIYSVQLSVVAVSSKQ